MTSELLWTLIAIQIAMGAFDTLYHHELTERLAWRPSQGQELKLHAIRNFFYAAIFTTLGTAEVHGVFAWVLIAVLAVEVAITLMDFVEEDMSRKLPATERINHTLLALNYGAILVLAVPVLLDWAARSTGVVYASYGWWSVLALVSALGVGVFGLRDLVASRRSERLLPGPAAELMAALPPHRRVLVTGATGFIGSRLVEALAASGHQVIALVRDPAKAVALSPPVEVVTSLDQLHSGRRIDAIVNLAGEPIANGPWTAAKRARIVQSRIDMTDAVLSLVARLEHKPSVLVSGSAVGWYGLRGDEELTEDSPPADCFSHRLCAAWEERAMAAAALGLRVVTLRTGLVLASSGGFLARLLTPFEFGLGGPIGTGRQWMPWIHRDDLVRLIAHCIGDERMLGPVNATAPEPVTNADFTKALALALHRPALFRVPAWPLKFALGDFAEELLLGGQRVFPAKAKASGFVFRYPELGTAFNAILGSGGAGVEAKGVLAASP